VFYTNSTVQTVRFTIDSILEVWMNRGQEGPSHRLQPGLATANPIKDSLCFSAVMLSRRIMRVRWVSPRYATMLRTIAGLFLILIPVQVVSAQDQITISLKTGDRFEVAAQEQLERILKSYNLSKWIFTKSVIIERGVIPHSHPVLTLNSRHLDNDLLQLSTFVHEQIHWHLVAKSREADQAIEELRGTYTTVPTEPPSGAGTQDSTYLHLLVNYLEYQAMKELVGTGKAKEVFEFWAKDHYTWIYKTLLADEDKIRLIVDKHKLQI